MQRRPLGNTGLSVSPIGLGCWAIGGSWGEVDDDESRAALHRAIDLGVDFFDTADVYGDGKSERLIAEVLRERRADVFVATKIGRRAQPHTAESYTRTALTAYVDRCLENLGRERLDLVQLHCPPTAVYHRPEIFEALDGLVQCGKVRCYGVSVERVEEAELSLAYPNVQTVQIVFNVFRQRPAESFFVRARAQNVGIIARIPLASGLLTGKLGPGTVFSPSDHRAFNREGQAFDQGETFAGVPYELGLRLAEALRDEVQPGATLGQWALRWVLMHDAVSVVIPGAKRPAQVEENLGAARLPPLSDASMVRTRELYDRELRSLVHERW